jgi:glycine cleavage system H lipoate-binding protein
MQLRREDVLMDVLLQKELGDLVFVELPEAGSPCKQGEKFASVESVKAVSDVYSPISGTVVEVNTSLSESPDLVSKHTSTLGSLKEIGISIPDKSRFQEWEHLLQSRKSKHHHFLELPKESTTLLNCKRNNQSLAHLQKKASLAQSQWKKEITCLVPEERIACSIDCRRKNCLLNCRKKNLNNGLLVVSLYFLLMMPLQINKSPYGDGWLMKLTVSNKGELDGLMGADAYKQHQAANAH